MSLPFVIVLYALIRDDTGVGGGGQRQSNLGTCLRLIFHVCMFHLPSSRSRNGNGNGGGGINEASDAQLGRSWRHLLSPSVAGRGCRERERERERNDC